MKNTGFKALFIGELIARRMSDVNDIVTIHHITINDDSVQLELERRNQARVSFERVVLSGYSEKLVTQYVHKLIPEINTQTKTIAHWLLTKSNEQMKVHIISHHDIFEQQIKCMPNVKFLGWDINEIPA